MATLQTTTTEGAVWDKDPKGGEAHELTERSETFSAAWNGGQITALNVDSQQYNFRDLYATPRESSSLLCNQI